MPVSADDTALANDTAMVLASWSMAVQVPQRYVGLNFCHPGRMAALKNAWAGDMISRDVMIPSFAFHGLPFH